MIRLMQLALCAITLLLCGVLAADPTLKGGSHTLFEHEEIYEAAFCAVSYAIVMKQTPSSTPRSVVEDLAARRDHFKEPILSYLAEEGHPFGEVQMWLVYWFGLMPILYPSGDAWMADVHAYQCKEKSESAALIDSTGNWKADATAL